MDALGYYGVYRVCRGYFGACLLVGSTFGYVGLLSQVLWGMSGVLWVCGWYFGVCWVIHGNVIIMPSAGARLRSREARPLG